MVHEYQRVNYKRLKNIPKPEEDDERDGQEEADGHNEDALKDLTQYMTRTPDARYSEATNIPLDLVLPLSMMAGYLEKEFRNLCGEIVTAQRSYAAMRMPFHPNEVKADFEEEAKMVMKQGLLSEAWRLELYKHRRSVGGDHIKRVEGLAQEQLASNQLKADEGGPPVFHEN